MAERLYRGVIVDGKFKRCGRVQSQCMGSAARGPHACTCLDFTAQEVALAAELELSIDDLRDLPIEWLQKRRHYGSPHEGLCEECHGTDDKNSLVVGLSLSICEPCARRAVKQFVEYRKAKKGHALAAMPVGEGADG